jgi:hypothetical protein
MGTALDSIGIRRRDMDLHITISGSYSFTVTEELAKVLVEQFPDNVQITEKPEQDQE